MSRWLGYIYIPPQTPPLAKEWLSQWNFVVYLPISLFVSKFCNKNYDCSRGVAELSAGGECVCRVATQLAVLHYRSFCEQAPKAQ